MRMAHFHTKTKKGRPYLYVREIARINGKPKVVSQTYIGSPEKVRELVKGGDPAIRSIRVDEFGALWLAMRADEEIDLANIVDEIIPSDPRETGPSVGEYFLYAILNRMIEPKSKRELPDWYRNTAIQEIRPVNVSELSSQRFGAKWDRVSPEDLEKIAKRFFNKVWEKEEANGDCLLFDTTNHYTYMSSKTPSELARRGKNKAGKHHLRQIGTALLVGRTNRLPLFYREYPGNLHDSNIFNALIGEMLEIASMVSQNKQRLTIIFDKGMNSDPNFEFLDDSPLLHFITTYSPYFASDFASLPLSQFAPLDIKKNRLLEEEGKSDERLMAYRTSGEFWGKKRAVIVTHNPGNARKQEYVFSGKLEEIRKNLLEMRMKFNEGAPHWKTKTIFKNDILVCAGDSIWLRIISVWNSHHPLVFQRWGLEKMFTERKPGKSNSVGTLSSQITLIGKPRKSFRQVSIEIKLKKNSARLMIIHMFQFFQSAIGPTIKSDAIFSAVLLP